VKNVSNDASVQSAATTLSQKLGQSSKLYAIVNNAGTGFCHNTPPSEILDTNTRGPRRVVDAFLPYLDPTIGRIVNLGSGAGPMFVGGNKLSNDRKRRYLNPMDNKEIEEEITHILKMNDEYAAYGGSKALLACYTMKLAQLHPSLSISILSPGYILTDMTRGMGATKSPEEGTVSLIKCLFEDLPASGYFWGSDGLRSPLHYLRNPGEPEYDGTMPSFS
jgi:carbonyl reductase 1